MVGDNLDWTVTHPFLLVSVATRTRPVWRIEVTRGRGRRLLLLGPSFAHLEWTINSSSRVQARFKWRVGWGVVERELPVLPYDIYLQKPTMERFQGKRSDRTKLDRTKETTLLLQ